MKKIKIPFYQSESEIPIIEVALGNGTKTLAIVDSGSETTLIDKDFILENKNAFKVSKSRDMVSYTGLVSAQKMPAIVADTYVLPTGCKKYLPLHGYVFDMSYVSQSLLEAYNIDAKILIGSDTLNEYNAELNYEKKELIIKHDLSGK